MRKTCRAEPPAFLAELVTRAIDHIFSPWELFPALEVISGRKQYSNFCCPFSVDRVLHLLHQDHRLPSQVCRSIPVEVALPGLQLLGNSLEFISEDHVLGIA